MGWLACLLGNDFTPSVFSTSHGWRCLGDLVTLRAGYYMSDLSGGLRDLASSMKRAALGARSWRRHTDIHPACCGPISRLV